MRRKKYGKITIISKAKLIYRNFAKTNHAKKCKKTGIDWKGLVIYFLSVSLEQTIHVAMFRIRADTRLSQRLDVVISFSCKYHAYLYSYGFNKQDKKKYLSFKWGFNSSSALHWKALPRANLICSIPPT